MEVKAGAELQRLSTRSFRRTFLTQEPNASEEPWECEKSLKGKKAQLALPSSAADTTGAAQFKKRSTRGSTCTDIVPLHTAPSVVERDNQYGKTDYLSKCIEEMRNKLEMMKISVKEREAQNVQRLLHQTRAVFLKRLDRCREQSEKLEARKARFKELVLARSRLLQRNVEKAEECRRLLVDNTKDRQRAEEDVILLNEKAAKIFEQCASIERLGDQLQPFKLFVEAAAGLCVVETAEGVVRRVTTLQNTNEELRRCLDDSSDRLEEKQAQYNARHAQGSRCRLALSSRASFLRSQIEVLRQTRQELEQAIDAKAQLVAKDAAAVGAVCTHVQMLHAAAVAAGIAAVEREFVSRAAAVRAGSSGARKSKLSLDVMRALRLLQQTGELAYKYKSMIQAAEQQLLPLRHRAARWGKSASVSTGPHIRLLLKGLAGGKQTRGLGGPDMTASSSTNAVAAEPYPRSVLNVQLCNGSSSNDSPSDGRHVPPARWVSLVNAGQDLAERPVGGSPRNWTNKRNGTPNHVTLLYEERGRRVAASPGEENEDVVQFLLLEREKKNSPFHPNWSRIPPSSVTAALLRPISSRVISEKEVTTNASSRSSPIHASATSPSQTSPQSVASSSFFHDVRIAPNRSGHASTNSVLLSGESCSRESSARRPLSDNAVSGDSACITTKTRPDSQSEVCEENRKACEIMSL